MLFAVLVSNMPNVFDKNTFDASATSPDAVSSAGVPAPVKSSLASGGPTTAPSAPRVSARDETVLGASVSPKDPWLDVRMVNAKNSKVFAVSSLCDHRVLWYACVFTRTLCKGG